MLVFGLAALPTPARAQTQTSEYTVDAAQGPVIGSTRVIGLGGAFVAIAENMDGVPMNPASVAVRPPYSWHRWDYTFGVSVSAGGWLPHTDFLNRGSAQGETSVTQRSLLFGSLGGVVYFRHAGAGVAAEGQRQALRRGSNSAAGFSPADLSGNFGVVHSSIAFGFFDGQLVAGTGPRIVGMSFSGDSGSGLLNVGGIGFQGGVIYKPIDQPFRVGAAYKSAVQPSLDGASSDATSAYRTRALSLPWQLAVGAAYQFGPRPLNPPFMTVERSLEVLRRRADERAAERRRQLAAASVAYRREPTAEHAQRVAELIRRDAREAEAQRTNADSLRVQAQETLRQAYLSRPRHHLLVTTELLILGASADGIGFASYWQGNTSAASLQLSGQNITVSPRIGLETEAIPNGLMLRAGSYLEPARARGASDRIHGTFGLDVKTFRWDAFGLIGEFDAWKICAAVDVARQYVNMSFSLGFWH